MVNSAGGTRSDNEFFEFNQALIIPPVYSSPGFAGLGQSSLMLFAVLEQSSILFAV